MLVPLSWLRDFVEIDIPIGELAHRLTLAGLEVEGIRYVGLPLPESGQESGVGLHSALETHVTGFAWDPDKIVVGAVLEVMPHPNADRLVLCRLDDGEREHVVLTGAPNLFPYKGHGPLERPIMVAYAREGAVIYDGHKPGWELTKLKRAKIRGVESYSMACSEKELGISEEHEGIIVLDDDAVAGTPLVEYMGDVVFDIAITPNVARAANILGVAREVAALTGEKLKEPSYKVVWDGPPIEGRVSIDIRHPDLNPRFVLGLIEGVKIGPSPYKVQRRLRLAGMRPINNVVDATNYAMLEIGEPLHAFDYDVLVERAGGETPTIITRLPEPGEKLTTLDDIERELDDFTVLVADAVGALSLAGVMGGAESEVSEKTSNILLEGAAWNYVNVRRTVASQKLASDAAYRFERGVHPSMSERGVRRGLQLMASLTGGVVAQGLADSYPLLQVDPTVEIKPEDVRRWLGISIGSDQVADILQRLEFQVRVEGEVVHATAPDHRLDIGEGIVGVADVMEEVARIYGYDRIPETQISDTIPPQYSNPSVDAEERVRDLLVSFGLQEVVTYRLTSTERERRLLPPDGPVEDKPYIRLINPIVSDRNVMRRSLLSSVLEVVERNARVREHIALFEIGSVYIPKPQEELPDEPRVVAIALTGPRAQGTWQGADTDPMNFYDLKGMIDTLLKSLHLDTARYEPVDHPTFHPGKCSSVLLGDQQLGVFGEIHPLVHRNFEFPETALQAAELDLEAIIAAIPEGYGVQPVPAYPPVLEDLAIVIDEGVPAEQVEAVIREAGGRLLVDIQLFDLYMGEQIGEGKKSLAFALVYQAPDRTLRDEDVAKLREKVITRINEVLGAQLRS
jgi:phenylalanyl-tRNA synthetase beta chain